MCAGEGLQGLRSSRGAGRQFRQVAAGQRGLMLVEIKWHHHVRTAGYQAGCEACEAEKAAELESELGKGVSDGEEGEAKEAGGTEGARVLGEG